MLEPQQRRHLLESLRPPQGYVLDFAIGTTFSLDLPALLITPVAFTFFDWEDQEGRPAADPLALLEAIRRHSERIAIFCQAGQIHIPVGIDHRLCTYLESSIIEVTPRKAPAVFHPKVWVLRFTRPDHPVRYRLLNLTRNLTFDRSWDTILALEGELTTRRAIFEHNLPLCDFVSALPDLAIRPISPAMSEQLALVQRELRRVAFQAPVDFDQIAFWPLGIRRTPVWPFPERATRMMVISPFVSDRCLLRLANSSPDVSLISRPESMDALPSHTLARCSRLFSLHNSATPDESAEVTEDALDGLHAKLFLAESGWDARLWTGSANGTDAAFNGNVEFLVELTGKKTRVGIDSLLGGADDRLTLRDLLHPYTPPVEPVIADAAQQALEQRVDVARRALAKAQLVACVRVEGTDTYGLHLERDNGNPLTLPAGVSVECWPITLADTNRKPVIVADGQAVATFVPVSFEAITVFYAFRVYASQGEKTAVARFVLTLPLCNAPADRHDRILRSLLSTSDQVLRYLLLLLAEGGGETPGIWEAFRKLVSGEAQGQSVLGDLSLLECLLRTADRDPEKLKQVRRLVEDLCRQPDGATLLPEGFLTIWEPIQAVTIGGAHESVDDLS